MDALRALKVRGVHVHTGVLVHVHVHHVITSRRATIQARVRKLSGMGSGPPKRRKGEPPAASRPAWQKAPIKGRLEGQGGQPGVPNILYPLRFTQKVSAHSCTEKREASVHSDCGPRAWGPAAHRGKPRRIPRSRPAHTLALRGASLRIAQCRDHDGGQSPTRRHAHV